MSNVADLNTERPKPTTLYKFRTWTHCDKPNKQHQSVLTEGILWAPVAKDLNDPFDCCIPFRHDLMNRVDLTERVARLLKEQYPEMPWSDCLRDSGRQIDEKGILDPKRKEEVLSSFALLYRSNHAVLSFAGVANNPLLWSHYADSYKGLCVGIEMRPLENVLKEHFWATKISFQEAWVNYMTNFPIEIPSKNEEEDFDAYCRLFTTKSLHWNYEEEYRYVFASKIPFALKLNSECISQVILGSEMPAQHRDEIIEIAAKKYPQAKVLQARRKSLSFELEFIRL